MADIQLTKPAANQTQTVTSAADARFVLNFSTGDAKFSKSENGENLVMTFDDGAKIEVEGFYTTFNKDSLPTLQVGGADITGEQLAAVLGEDLMPAAGPGTGQAAAQGGRFRTFADADLNGGIDRLGGLDIGFPDEVQLYDSPDNYAVADDASATVSGGEDDLSSPKPAPQPLPVPTPTPEPEPDHLEANDDPHAAAVLNTLTVENFIDLSNDNTGSLAATAVAGTGEPTSKLPVGVTASLDGNALQLHLDAEKMLGNNGLEGEESGFLSQISNDGYTHVADRVINYANELKTFNGEYRAKYTASDDSGEFTDTAWATFSVGDNTGTMTGTAAGDVAWMRGNSGSVETGAGKDFIMVASNDGKIDAGAGNDTIALDDSKGVVDGGRGADWINVSGTNWGTISGGAGSEDGSRNPVRYRLNDDPKNGGIEYYGDLITVQENAGVIYGGNGIKTKSGIYDDIIDVVEGKTDDAGNATNSVYGGAGNDRLVLRGGSSLCSTAMM